MIFFVQIVFNPHKISLRNEPFSQHRVNILGEYECWVVGIVPVTTEDNDSEEYLEDMTWAVLKNFSPLFVTDQWESETLKGKKVTIVFSDEKLMNAVQEKFSNARFNNSFSLMLVDLHKVVIVPLGGIGSFSLRGRLPGLPSSIFSAVGLGFLPRVAIRHTSFP